MAQDHMFALAAGSEVAGYRFGEVLGSGGYGITYKADEVALGRVVAIKEYLPNAFARRGTDRLTVKPREAKQQEVFAWGLERFRQEAETLVKLQHPNIVRVLRYFAANGTAYIVMVYERGISLGERLRGANTLSNAELHALIDPLLGGIEIVHKAGFLHRDIKPDNIYLRGDGSPVLLDFGSARQAIGARTQSITSIVSPGYSPFEQYGQTVDEQGPWTDIYSLGATLYRCIAGERPPTALDRVGGKSSMPSAVKLGQGRYDLALLEAIDRALATRAEDRPQNIAIWRALMRGDAAQGAGAQGAGAHGAGARGKAVAAEPGATLVAGASVGNNGAASVVVSEAGATLTPGPAGPAKKRTDAGQAKKGRTILPTERISGLKQQLTSVLQNAQPGRLAVLAGILFAAIIGLLVVLIVLLGGGR